MRRAENRAFTAEARRGAGANRGRAQELDRDVPFEAAVAAPRAPDAPHAALADERLERVGAHRLAGFRRRSEDERVLFEESAVTEPRVLVEQRPQFGGERGIAGGELLQPRTAFLGRHLERAVELRAENFPAIGAKARHCAQYPPERIVGPAAARRPRRARNIRGVSRQNGSRAADIFTEFQPFANDCEPLPRYCPIKENEEWLCSRSPTRR